jgi:hypothetical protein
MNYEFHHVEDFIKPKEFSKYVRQEFAKRGRKLNYVNKALKRKFLHSIELNIKGYVRLLDYQFKQQENEK